MKIQGADMTPLISLNTLIELYCFHMLMTWREIAVDYDDDPLTLKLPPFPLLPVTQAAIRAPSTLDGFSLTRLVQVTIAVHCSPPHGM